MKYIYVLADETSDKNHVEQAHLSLRFVTDNEMLRATYFQEPSQGGACIMSPI